MKALVLAAGLGTRLLPYTRFTPKPLFTVGSRPLLDIIIDDLEKAGCEAVVVNTHHLAPQIESYISNRTYSIPVQVRYEPEILGTGGAIKNLEDFWDDRPFLVINSDIFTDIDIAAVYQYHLSHPHPVTMALHDCPEINTVSVGRNNRIIGFPAPPGEVVSAQSTFTGIQALNPDILEDIPSGQFSSSIESYKRILSKKQAIKAYISNGRSWTDLGTPNRYRSVAYEQAASKAFQRAYPDISPHDIDRTLLAGDGSDRLWYRLNTPDHSLIMADHGIRNHHGVTESEAFVAIGSHLHRSGISVPKICSSDPFPGLVFMEDLGDTNLQSMVLQPEGRDLFDHIYRPVIDLLIHMSIRGAEGFDPGWTYQTAEYDRTVILEKECRYFLDAFVNGYLGYPCHYADYESDFHLLADRAVQWGMTGFMHRDFQSRNIMVKEERFFVIDFQGGRFGPIQYDLASLVIDPYVSLPPSLQHRLVEYCADGYASTASVSKDAFMEGYRFCAVTRNLQILGACGFLSRVKKKPGFARYIPAAIDSLHEKVGQLPKGRFASLRRLVADLYAIKDTGTMQ